MCLPCPAGTYGPDTARTSNCSDLCAVGQYSFSGASACASCPSNSNSSQGSSIFGCACNPGYEAEVEEAAQWIMAVTGFSSEYSNSSHQILGPPDVYPNTMQSEFAWTPFVNCSACGVVTDEDEDDIEDQDDDLQADPHQWLEFVIRHPVRVSGIEIFETNAPGACVKIQLLNDRGIMTTVWEGGAQRNLTGARIFAPPLEPMANKTQMIRLEFDMTNWTDAYQIDAVRVTAEAQTGWVTSVDDFSSQYHPEVFAATEILGPPDAYPSYGLSPVAWTHSRLGAGAEWLELVLSRPQIVGAVHIYETNAPGRCVKISLEYPDGGWDVVWEQQSPSVLSGVARIFAPPLAPRSYVTSRIRIEADTTGLFDFYQIDAVRVIPRTSHWVDASCNDSLRTTQMVNIWPVFCDDEGLICNTSSVLTHCRRSCGLCPSWNQSRAVKSSCEDTSSGECSVERQKLVGPPTAYPQRYVDNKGAWTPKPDIGGSDNWVEITLDRPILVSAVSVYETNATGALNRIRLLDPQGNWDTVWQLRRRQPPPVETRRVLTPQLSARSYKTQQIRLEVNSTNLDPYYAIDAVSVVEGIEPVLPIFMCSPVYDNDGDGSISQAEWEAKWEAKLER